MYILNNGQPSRIEETTFSKLNMLEDDVEEILRRNIDMLCDEEESLLIVGQQVRNEKNARSDLTAIDNNGNLVLIEIKRDRTDIEHRREAFEFQAIRYAASCATVSSPTALIQDVFEPYVEKHKEEFTSDPALTSAEIAQRCLSDFMMKNTVIEFNERQRIILVASEFDEQTLSAVAWLNSNHVDISCWQLCPYALGDQVLLEPKKLLPVLDYEDFYIDLAGADTGFGRGKNRDISRRSLPKIDMLIKWGVVSPGDILTAKGTEFDVELMPDGRVDTGRGVMSMQQWLKGVYGWSSVQTYDFAVDKKTGRTLAELRAEYMEQQDTGL